MIISLDPATGRERAAYPYHNGSDVEARISAAVAAQTAWRATEARERAALLVRMAALLRAGIHDYAGLIASEMGKPITEAFAEVEKCAWNCDFYAENGARFLADEAVDTDYVESVITYEPLGTILAIMPWNYPFWQVFRFLAPALVAGNAVLLKHADNASGCALAAEDLFRKAGGPEGLFSALLVRTVSVADLVGDPRIAALTFTGSTRVGGIVAAQAAATIKKQVLELGGSDPFIVLADADIHAAARAATQARFANAGQACINAKRFIVDERIADAFVGLFLEEVRKLVVGDPRDPATTIGPMARADLRDNLHAQVVRSIDEGAELLTGGRFGGGDGFFYEPTVLDHVTPAMTVFREETFGPVAAIARVTSEDQAVALANATEYGLGASIWSSNVTCARSLAGRIDAGAVFVNAVVTSDPRLPFGGVKRSGYGRELGRHGLREFVNVKTIVRR